jgi:hypothetical protein
VRLQDGHGDSEKMVGKVMGEESESRQLGGQTRAEYAYEVELSRLSSASDVNPRPLQSHPQAHAI